MTDIWAFLLQTLTLSVTAGLLLLIKRILEDKLSPRWQYGVWSVLLLSALVPANFLGRYGLFDLPLLVEWSKTAAEVHLSSAYTTAFSMTRVLPFPIIPGTAPQSVTDWLFVVYLAGVGVSFLRYLLSYLRLRRLLRHGTPVPAETAASIQAVAQKYGLTPCPAVLVEGLAYRATSFLLFYSENARKTFVVQVNENAAVAGDVARCLRYLIYIFLAPRRQIVVGCDVYEHRTVVDGIILGL